MARGWESKSVEAQIEEFNAEAAKPHDLSAEKNEVERKKSGLLLSRQRVLQEMELSSNERYSELLRRTLRDLEAQVADLN